VSAVAISDDVFHGLRDASLVILAIALWTSVIFPVGVGQRRIARYRDHAKHRGRCLRWMYDTPKTIHGARASRGNQILERRI
jgi:hypothetical protein